MEPCIKEVDCLQQLNTKGCCFLCLETEEKNIEGDRHSDSIRSLLRHLQIKSFKKEIFDGKDIEVYLCKNCKNIFKGFSNVLEELEKVQLKMNYFLERISKAISGSKKDSKRVQVYSKRMTDDPETLAQLAFVDDLRKKLAVKSLKMQVGPILCIKLERTKKTQVKEEVDCSEEFNEAVEDVFDDNGDQKLSAPEPVPPSLKPPSEPIKQEKEANLLPKETKPSNFQKPQTFYYKKITETGMYQCKKCDKSVQSRQAILYHFQSVHLKKRFKCDVCNISSYMLPFELKIHQKSCRETLKERLVMARERKGFKFACDLCGKRFKCNTGLQSHRQGVHNNINRFACNLCDKKYTKLCDLKEHENAVHFGKVFYCRFCSKGFRHKKSLRRHEKMCKEEGKFKTESN